MNVENPKPSYILSCHFGDNSTAKLAYTQCSIVSRVNSEHAVAVLNQHVTHELHDQQYKELVAFKSVPSNIVDTTCYTIGMSNIYIKQNIIRRNISYVCRGELGFNFPAANCERNERSTSIASLPLAPRFFSSIVKILRHHKG